MKKIVFKSFFFVLLFGLVLSLSGVIKAANDVTTASGASLILPSDSSNYTLGTNTTVQSYTINNSSFDFVVEASSVINLTSTDRKNFTVSNSGDCGIVQTCSTVSSVITISCPGSITQRTLNIVPSGTCTLPGGGAGSSGGGGGYVAPTPVTVITTTTPTIVTPVPVVIPEPVVILPIEAPLVVTVSNELSKIAIVPPAVASFQPGAPLKFNYQYTNDGPKTVTVRVVRQLLNSSGKVIKTTSLYKTLKSGASFNGLVNETFAKTLPAGEYTVVVKILDGKGKVLEENSFVINVEKLKKKYFILGAEFPSATDIAFDEATWNKVKSNVILPATLKLKYSYTNSTLEKHTVRMVRELIDGGGKVLETKTGKWVMAPGEIDSLDFVQTIGAKLEPGAYTVRIRAYDWTSKEILAENSAGFVVELK